MRGVSAIASSEPADPDQGELAELVATCSSWGELMRKLGGSTSTRQYRRVRSISESAQIDTSHFVKTGGPPIEDMTTPFANAPDPESHLRRAGVAMAMQWFLNRGYMVSLPVDHVAYDLVAESDAGLQRIQVKTTNQNRNGSYVVAITRHEYGTERLANGYYWRARPYLPGEIDLFFICTGSGFCYLIPLLATRGQMSLTLDDRVASYRVN